MLAPVVGVIKTRDTKTCICPVVSELTCLGSRKDESDNQKAFFIFLKVGQNLINDLLVFDTAETDTISEPESDDPRPYQNILRGC